MKTCLNTDTIKHKVIKQIQIQDETRPSVSRGSWFDVDILLYKFSGL